MILPSVLVALTVAVTAVALVLAVFVVGVRLVRLGRERKAAGLLAPHRLALLAVSAGEDDDGEGLAHLRNVEPSSWHDVGPTVTDTLAKLRGQPADDLVSVLRHHGDIDRAVSDLRSGSVVRRARAAHLLGLVRDPERVPDLIPLLSDRSAEVRLVAVRALGAIGDPAAADEVLASVGMVRGRVGVPAFVVAEALASMGSGTKETLLHGLHKQDPVVRTVAALVAGHLTLVSASRSLRELLDHDPDTDVRLTASAALGRVGGPEDVSSLVRHTSPETTPPLRRACAAALGDLGAPNAAEGLLPLLADQDRRLAEIAARSLIRLGPVGTARLAETLAGTPTGRVARAAVAADRLPELVKVPT